MSWISWIWFRPEAWHTKFSMVEKPILDRLQILNFYYKVGAGYTYTPPVLPSNPIFFWNSRDDKAVPTRGRSSMVMHARAAGDVLLFPRNVWPFYSSDLPGFYQYFINKSCFLKSGPAAGMIEKYRKMQRIRPLFWFFYSDPLSDLRPDLVASEYTAFAHTCSNMYGF